MKRWIGAFFLALLLTILLGASAQADITSPQFDQKVVMAKPGETVHFNYSVPEGFEVKNERWYWYYTFTLDGTGHYDIGDGTYYFDEEYEASLGLDPDLVTWDGEGGISCEKTSCILCVCAILNEPTIKTVKGFVCIGAPKECFEYEIHDGEVTITGRHDEILPQILVIPDEIDGYPVTAIGDRAFYQLQRGGYRIFIPDSVTSIGEEAFAVNPYLTAVRLPQRLTSMGRAAFGACLQLISLYIPDSLTYIPEEAFINCWMLGTTSVSLPASIGRNVTSIGKNAFAGCFQLGRLWNTHRLPESLVSIGEGAFQSCRDFKELEIPSGVTVIRDHAFENCDQLKSIQMDGPVTSIGTAAFKGCTNLESIAIPATVTYIGADAFRDCLSLTGFELDEQNPAYEVIGGGLLTQDLSRLLAYAVSSPETSFTAPEALTTVAEGAFRHVRYLETLTLPDGFTDYAPGMFEDAANLQTVQFGEGTLTAIPDRFFYNCASLVSPTDYTGVSSVGGYAFFGCAALPSITFDETLTSIGRQAFQDCAALAQATLSNSLSEMGVAAFKNAVSLPEISLPASLRALPSSAFYGCTALQTVTFAEGLQIINANAFENAGLVSAALPASLQKIAAYAFAGCASLADVQLPEGLITLGTGAFSGSGITAAALPDSLTELGTAVYMNCAALAEAHLKDDMTALPTSMFENCSALAAIELPEALTSIGSRAFAGCAELAEIDLPRSIREIGSGAFADCTSLTRILLRPDIPQIASNAFAGCTELTIQGWIGSPAQAIAQALNLPFAPQDQGLTFALNAEENGYLISGCDENAFFVAVPSTHEGLPVVGVQEGAFSACIYLSAVSVDAANDSMRVENGLLLTADGGALLLCPARLGVTGVTVPDSVTSIAPWAFTPNKELRTITIGAQVAVIGDNAFADTDEALCLIVSDGSPAQLWAAACGMLYASESTQFTYRVEDGKAWITGYTGVLSDVVVPSVIEGYPVYGIEDMRSSVLKRVTVSDGVAVIGQYAFTSSGTGVLECVYLPDTVTTISVSAFGGQQYLREIALGSGVTEIDGYAFAGCSSLKQITLPDSLRMIGLNAFYGSGLEILTIPVGITSIGVGFVDACESLRGLQFAEGNTNYVFENGLLYENSTHALLYAVPNLEGPVTVREGTEIIRESVFNERGITSVSLPASLTSIESKAFYLCSELTSVHLPEGLLSIGTYAFYGCEKLSDIALPDSLVSLGSEAFYNCKSLTEMTIPSGITYLNGTFMYCSSLRSVTLPEGLLAIYYYTFYHCENLETLNLPASLTTFPIISDVSLPPNLKTVTTSPGAVRFVLEDGILYDLQENAILFVNASVGGAVTIRDGITSISSHAFENRTELTAVTLPESCVDIGEYVFSGCTSLSSVTLPESCTGISDYMFLNCTSLSSIQLPASCTSIGNSAFSGCTALTDDSFLSNLTYIGNSAMHNTGLTTLTLSQPNLYIGPCAFEDCHALTEATITSENVDIHTCVFLRCDHLQSVVLPEEITEIVAGLFCDCPALTEFTVPENVTTIGERAFSQCRNLTTVRLPDGLTTIGNEAFFWCYALTDINIPASVTAIGSEVFYDCSAIREITLPAGLTTLGESAFFRASGIRDLVVPAQLTHIPAAAFCGVSSLQSVTFPDGLISIGANAFAGTSLSQVDLPETLTSLGANAFGGTPLVSVGIPGSITSLEGAFSGCTELESVSLTPGVQRIGEGAFRGCISLTEINLPASVTAVDANAFYGCTALTSLGTQAALTFVGERAFGGCTALTSLDTQGALTFIGEGAFSGCEQLQQISVSAELTEIPTDAFSGCTKLVRVSPAADQPGVVLPGITKIGDRAFQGCASVRSFTFCDGLTTVGEYAFDSTTASSFYFPDTVTEIGVCAIWRNSRIESVHLPNGLTVIPQSMFSSAENLQTLTIPSSVQVIGFQAFYLNGSLGALKLPDGVREIQREAFAHSTLLLEIPASVTTIAPNAFREADVEFYTPEGSTAHQYALAHNIPVHLNESVPSEYLLSAEELSASIVAEVVTDDMTVYQKAEALVDWMLDNVTLDDMLADTYCGKMVLLRYAGSRWGWAFGYKALLNAANITNDIYFTAKGIVDGQAIGGGAVTISYLDGEAVNMIMIDGNWYFTHPAFTDRFGKESYFMMNRDIYRLVFNADPNVENCDQYDHSFLYQAYSKDIEQEVVEQASASFAAGDKLVYAEVSCGDIPYYEQVMNYAGMHMDTLTWNNAQGEFEPVIVGTEYGYWLSDDLTGEYAEVTLPNAVYAYGERLNEHPAYSAILCGLDVEGTFIFEEQEETPVLMRGQKGISESPEPTRRQAHVVTGAKTYQVTFVPMLSQFVHTLAPTVFTWTVQCQLPTPTDTFAMEGNNLIVTQAEDRVFVENGQLEFTFTPVDGTDMVRQMTVEDSAALYENGVRIIPIPSGLLRCGSHYSLRVVCTGDGYVSSRDVQADITVVGGHQPVLTAVLPATEDRDGVIGPVACAVCGEALGEAETISSARILRLPGLLTQIEAEAFCNASMEQVTLPSGVSVIGSKAFANCFKLRLVVIPSMHIDIASDAFDGSGQVILLAPEGSDAQEYAQAQQMTFFVMR